MSGKLVSVVGLGETGLSLARHFASRGWSVVALDSRAEPPGLARAEAEIPGLSCVLGKEIASSGKLLAQADKVVVSPGVAPGDLPQGLAACGDLDVFLGEWGDATSKDEAANSRLVAITGTNGKSTVTSLVTQMLVGAGRKAMAVGNIGVPLLDACATWRENGWPEFVVAELSSYQLARLTVNLGADAALLLNVSADHLDWHGSMEAYSQAKAKIYQGASVGLCDRQVALAAKAASQAKKVVEYDSLAKANGHGWGIGEECLHGPDGRQGPKLAQLVAVGIVPASACAALGMAGILDAGGADAHASVLENARGLDHRLQVVGESEDGICFVDDSKATNVDAACMALLAMEGGSVPLVGGDGKQQDFAPLAEHMSKLRVPAAIVIGEGNTDLCAALEARGVSWQVAADMAQAVGMASIQARRHKARNVLLSPACASFGQYENFAMRGRDFARSVREILR